MFVVASPEQRLPVFRIRDVIVVAFVLISILQCYYQPINYEYQIEPIWFVETFDSNSQHQSPEVIIHPIIIDLDRDNVKDLVSVGLDNVLRVSRVGFEMPSSLSHV